MRTQNDITVLEMLLPAESEKVDLQERASGMSGKEASPKPAGVVIGTLAGFDDFGRPLVAIPGTGLRDHLTALSTIALDIKAIGRAAVLQFEGGDWSRPVILGLLHQPVTPETSSEKKIEAALDGERLVFTAEKEIILRCGQASITLTRAGKVLIRGVYVLNRSSGVNRIKGGSVQIN